MNGQPLSATGVFLSEAPDPDRAERLRTFGQFVGSWDLVVTNHRSDGEDEVLEAEWHFAWALDGWAIQDVWIAPSRAVRAATGRTGEWGATLRIYDDAIGAWRSTWIGPRHGKVLPFIAREIDDEIVLEGSFEEGVVTRWIFSSITPTAFAWRAVESRDEGATWTLEQEMAATRQES